MRGMFIEQHASEPAPKLERPAAAKKGHVVYIHVARLSGAPGRS